MAKLLQTLVSIAALFLMVANMALSQTTHFQIDSFGPYPNDLTYEGDASVPSGKSFLRLTPANAGLVGRVMYSKPFTFWDEGKQVEFETTITFKITPTDDDPADGIAFFIAPAGYRIPDGSQGGNFGIFSSSGTADSVFAVEVDTYQNEWDPHPAYPPYRHIGIDINSHNSSRLKFFDDSVLGKVVTLTIKYDPRENTITAKAEVGSHEQYDVDYEYDLSDILEKEVQVGISAGTGGSVSNQDIISWEFTANMIFNSDATVDGAGIRQVVST